MLELRTKPSPPYLNEIERGDNDWDVQDGTSLSGAAYVMIRQGARHWMDEGGTFKPDSVRLETIKLGKPQVYEQEDAITTEPYSSYIDDEATMDTGTTSSTITIDNVSTSMEHGQDQSAVDTTPSEDTPIDTGDREQTLQEQLEIEFIEVELT